jgi:hypothetical protein
MLTDAEMRLLRFLRASRTTWTRADVIRCTNDLLPDDKRALPELVSRGFVLDVSGAAYRISEAGREALFARERFLP